VVRTSKQAAHEEPARRGPRALPLAGGIGGVVHKLSGRRAARRDRRSLHLWYTAPGLPLYGLPPDWTGHRCPGQRAGRQAVRHAGPFGIFTRPSGPLWVAALGLTHVAADGGRLHVASHRVANYQIIEAMAAGNLFRRLAMPLLGEAGREAFDQAVIARRAQFRAGQLAWRREVIPVDAAAVPFRTLRVGTDWVALAQVGDVCVQVDAQRFPVGRVRLVRVVDPRSYLPGFPAR
jgi:hypothetical protein